MAYTVVIKWQFCDFSLLIKLLYFMPVQVCIYGIINNFLTLQFLQTHTPGPLLVRFLGLGKIRIK
jgi:hypothetical protein